MQTEFGGNLFRAINVNESECRFYLVVLSLLWLFLQVWGNAIVNVEGDRHSVKQIRKVCLADKEEVVIQIFFFF